MSARDDVDAFLRSGACACPFARAAEVHYLEPSDVCPTNAELRAFERSMGATPTHALVVLGQADGFGAARIWAHDTFCALFLAVGALEGRPPQQIERVARAIRGKLADPAGGFYPLLGTRRDRMRFAILLGPFYHDQHPRYAPRPILVVTWLADVGHVTATSPKAVETIRCRMAAAHGYVYGADEIALEPPPICRAMVRP